MQVINIKNGQAHAIVPYHPAFIEKMQEQLHLSPCDSTKQNWTFPSEYIPKVRDVMETVYGESDIKTARKYCDAQLTFLKAVEAPTDGLCLYGKCLVYENARAGAESGEGVFYVSGGYTLKETENGRLCAVEQGSVAVLYNVPESILDKTKLPDGVACKLIARSFNTIRREWERKYSSGDCDSSLIPDVSNEAYNRWSADKNISWLDFLKANSCGTLIFSKSACSNFQCRDRYLTKEWPAGTDIESILSELAANGWKISYNFAPKGGTVKKELFHIPTQILLLRHIQSFAQGDLTGIYDRIRLYPVENEKEPIMKSAEHGYIRFGDIPAHGYSTDFSCELPQAGVSCYEAEIDKDGNYKFVNLSHMLLVNLSLSPYSEYDIDRPIYRIYGDVVGRGSDGEPLLEVTKWEKITGKCMGPRDVVEHIEELHSFQNDAC